MSANCVYRHLAEHGVITRTLVTATRNAWTTTAGARKALSANGMGWTGMLAALKAWVEHGLNLNEGFYA